MNWVKTIKTLSFLLALVLPVSLYAAKPEETGKTTEVGEVIFLAGDVSAINSGQSRPLQSGDKVYLGDEIATAEGGHVHVRFSDGGLISVRPDSRALIDTYQYDPEDNAASRVRIHLEKGVLRSATGKAGQGNRDGFRINTPIAAIGIRGTDFVIFADTAISRLEVNAGGVVMAPFSTDCNAADFSPCSGEASAELFASVSKALLEVRAGQDYALVITEGPTPDEITPPHPKEASLFEAFMSGSQRPIQQKIGLSAPGAETYEEGLENARRYLQEETLVQQAYALGELESSKPLPANRGLVEDPQFVWGRWGSRGGNSLSKLFYDGWDYAVADNPVFALLEKPGLDRPIPDVGTVSFKLNSYEAYIQRGSSLEAAGISNSALVIDFDQSRFATRLDIHAASLPGVVPVLGAGTLERGGPLNGYFLSDAGSPAKIDGILAPNAAEAGFLFNYQVSPGVNAVGATHWVNGDSLGIDMFKSLQH